MYPSEQIRCTPLFHKFSSGGGTSGTLKTRYTGGDFSILCGVAAGTVETTGITSTAACNWDFSVMESTAASVAGSVIAGATMTLGAATAFTMRGGVNCVLQVTTDCATTAGVTINGITYHGTAVGQGDDASAGARKIANAINGKGTSIKLPHYTAVPIFGAKDITLITADDDMGTGLTVTCTAGSGIQAWMNHLQGVIDVQGSKLSATNADNPKYIGVGCTMLTGLATSVYYVSMLSYPSGKPSTPGVKVSCTT